MSLSATSGSLAPGATATVTVSLNANADSLAAGSYTDTLSFVNTTTGNGNTSRSVSLTVDLLNKLAISVNQPDWGTVTPDSGLYIAGLELKLVATAAPYFRFMQWSGDASGTENPLNFLIEENATVLATFGELLTTNYPTPHWWLAAHGYTDNFESAVNHEGANGLPLWKSYIAGLDPNDPKSTLKLVTKPAPNENRHVLEWNPQTGRVYTLFWSDSPSSTFTEITEAFRLPASVSTFTNDPANHKGALFYKIAVEKSNRPETPP